MVVHRPGTGSTGPHSCASVCQIGSVVGNYLFKLLFRRVSWHSLFFTTVVIAAASSASQLMLMFRDESTGQTLSEQAHLPNVLFALGDDVVMATANQLLAMPILILMARLCPGGAEGTVYALVTSLQGVGGTVGGVISKLLTSASRVTNTDFRPLWRLILITSTAKLIAIPALPLVPRSLDFDESDEKRSIWAGLTVVGLFAGGLGWAIEEVVASCA